MVYFTTNTNKRSHSISVYILSRGRKTRSQGFSLRKLKGLSHAPLLKSPGARLEEGDGKVRTGAGEKLGLPGGTKKDIIERNKDPTVGRSHKFGGNRARSSFKLASWAFFCILLDLPRRFFTTTFTWKHLRSLCELLFFKRVIKIILVLISYVLRDLTHRRKQCIIELSIQCLTS